MKQVFVQVKEEVCNYMALLSMNVESRKKLTLLSATENGVDHKVTKAYEREYFIYDAAYKEAMNKVQSIIPVELQQASTTWTLDFNTFVLTVNIADDVAEEYTRNPNHKDLYSEETWVTEEDIINTVIDEKLGAIYNTSNFDFERGLINE